MSTKPRRAVDTSVAIPLLVASHEAHSAVGKWSVAFDLCLAGHSLAETYSVLTRLPDELRVTPEDAVRLIDDLFVDVVPLKESTAAAVHHELAGYEIAGGASYDGLVALAARDAALVLATRDARALPTYEAVGTQVEVLAFSG